MPQALASLPHELKVTLREGTTPTLTRALRAGTLDLANLARTPPFRPPDSESPALALTTLSERELVIGVPLGHPFALAKLQIVAAGLTITTLAPVALDVLPDGVTAVAVRGEPQEMRRVVLARRPGPLNDPAARVVGALITAAST